MRFYAGIGSRETPDSILPVLTEIAIRMEQLGYCLRSGGALGADSAFEQGVKDHRNKIIVTPYDSNDQAEAIASKIHPNWNACNRYAKFCHGRNVMQILGQDLKTPVELVIAWTSGGKKIGGTRTGLVLAEQHNIPIFNLGTDSAEYALMRHMDTLSPASHR